MNPRILCFALVVLVGAAAFAAGVPNTTKVLVYSERPVAPAAMHALGGELIREYRAYALYRIPTSALGALREIAKGSHALIEEADSWDKLVFEHSTIDTRDAPDRRPVFANTASAGSVERRQADGRPRLYLVQFVGPMTDDDAQLIGGAGLVNVGYVPQNGVLVLGDASAMNRIVSSPGVQWVSPFEREHKRRVAGSPDIAREYIIQFVNAPATRPYVEDFRSAHNVLSAASYGNYTNLRVKLSPAEANELLDDPLVVTVELARIDRVSGEREAIADVAPLNPYFSFWPYQSGWSGTWIPYKGSPSYSYYSWINGYEYDASAYRVAVADTGLRRPADSCYDATVHPDLQYADIRWKDYVLTGGCLPQDMSGHGTFVTGLVAGRPAGSDPSLLDADSYYYDMGLVPFVSLYIQKITDGATNPSGTISQWASDAVSNGCVVQTHSHNEYKDVNMNPVPGGDYNLTAQQYDYAVRTYRLPMTVSTGNICDDSNCYTMVLSPATAKNVISVGSTESYRPNTTCDAGGTVPLGGQYASSLNNVASFSRRGTTDGRIKPDILAPGSLVSSTHAQGLDPQYYNNQLHPLFCKNVGPTWNAPTYPDGIYDIGSGTSFSAPQVAAAAPMISARYAARGGRILSPALLKAVLIGSAKSIKGGLDRYTSTQVAARPNPTQGFGRLFLNDVLAGVNGTWVGVDENQNAPLASVNDSRTGTFTIIDPTKPTVVALAWTDEPSLVTGGPTLVRDLNLTVTAGCARWSGNYLDTMSENSIQQDGCNGISFYADHTNNAEIVVIPANTAQGYSQMVITWKVDSTTWWESREDQSQRASTQPFAVFGSNVY